MSLPSVTESEVYITAQSPRLRNDLYCVEWDVKLYYTIQYHTKFSMLTCAGRDFKGQPAASPSQRGGVPAFRQIFGTAHLCPYSSTYRATKFGLETLVAEARVSKVSHSPHSSGRETPGIPKSFR